MNLIEAVVATAEILAVPVLLFLPSLRGPTMSVPAEIQAQLDAIRADLATIPDIIAAKVAAAESGANAAQAQNAADTLAAVSDLASAVHTAVSQ